MDAIRRSAAGELAELVGPGAGDGILNRDRSMRVYRFRHVAQQVLAGMNEADRRWLDAYVAGVNAGLRSLGGKPFEYLLLGGDPAPWAAEDSVLALLAMFVDLQGKDHERESALGVVRDVLPGPLAELPRHQGLSRLGRPHRGRPDGEDPRPGPRGLRPETRAGPPAPRRAPRPDASGGPRDPLRGQQQLGGLRPAVRDRRGDRRQRHAPEAGRAEHLVSGLADLPGGANGTNRRARCTAAGSGHRRDLARRPRHRHRQQRPGRLGAHQFGRQLVRPHRDRRRPGRLRPLPHARRQPAVRASS